MQFYIAVAYADPTHLCEIARTAEEAGFGGLIVSDHMIYPGELKTPYPYTSHGKPRWEPETPWAEPMVAIGAMSAVTTTLRFVTSVYLLVLRHPVLAAKAISTAAVMSNDRLTLGVGAGWMREEFDLLGIRFERRGARLGESIEVLRKVLAGGYVEHHGEFFDFEPISISPVPTKPVPIYGGGLSQPALRRAARLCDGWASDQNTRADLEVALGDLKRFRREAGREDEPFGICTAMLDVITLDGYREMGDLGVTELITVPWLFYGGKEQSAQQKCDGIRRFGEEVIAKL